MKRWDEIEVLPAGTGTDPGERYISWLDGKLNALAEEAEEAEKQGRERNPINLKYLPDTVSQGDTIGYMGGSGADSLSDYGIHLHFEVWKKGGYENFADKNPTDSNAITLKNIIDNLLDPSDLTGVIPSQNLINKAYGYCAYATVGRRSGRFTPDQLRSSR